MATLADHLTAVDVERFVGRDREMERLFDLLDPDSCIRMGFVHGPGGIGKSTLLDALSRKARQSGLEVIRIDGRRLGPLQSELEAAVGDFGRESPTLLVIDSFEKIGQLEQPLREEVLLNLPAETRLLIAGRRPLSPEWRRSGWGPVSHLISLGPLTPDEARSLAALEGIQPGQVESVLAWSRGEPLAIALAGEALRGDPEFDPSRLGSDEKVADALIRQIGEGRTDRKLLIAAVARSIDRQLLDDLLGPEEGGVAFGQIVDLSFSEPYGPRITLHERMRAAIKATERNRDPAGERLVRSSVAQHLDRRIRAGEPELIAELTALIEDPVIRRGINGSEIHRADVVRPGDFEQATQLAGGAKGDLWPWVERFFLQAPGRVVVAREANGRMAGFAIAVTPVNHPAWATEDPWLGPWLSHAEASPDGRESVIWRDTFDFTCSEPGADSSVIALLNAAATAASGLLNPRYFYGPVDSDDEASRELGASIGARHLPELDLSHSEGRIECHRLDHGPEGMLSTIKSLVARDTGAIRPAGPDRDVVEAALRTALRKFHNPAALAGNPLSRGEADARAGNLRGEIEAALREAFGNSRREVLLRQTIQFGYLDPRGSHDSAAHQLHLSRSTYFRRLREATDRLADYFTRPGR